MYKDFFELKLKVAIDRDKKELTLHVPRALHNPLTCKLDNMLMSGIMRLQANNVSRETSASKPSDSSNPFEDMKWSDIIAMLKVIPSDDYSFYADFVDTFKALVLSTDICKLKDNSQFNEGHYDQLIKPDAEKLMGEYIKNFFIK